MDGFTIKTTGLSRTARVAAVARSSVSAVLLVHAAHLVFTLPL